MEKIKKKQLNKNQTIINSSDIKPNIFLYEKLLLLLESTPKLYVNLAMKIRSNVIKLYQDKENLIKLIWKRCAIMMMLMIKSMKIRNKTISILEFLQKNSLMTFLDKLNSSKINDLNTLHIYLFSIYI